MKSIIIFLIAVTTSTSFCKEAYELPDGGLCASVPIADSKMRIEELRRSSRFTAASAEEIRRLELDIEIDQTAIRLMKKWNAERMLGKWQ